MRGGFRCFRGVVVSHTGGVRACLVPFWWRLKTNRGGRGLSLRIWGYILYRNGVRRSLSSGEGAIAGFRFVSPREGDTEGQLGTSYEHVRVRADIVLSYRYVWPRRNAGLEHAVTFVKETVDCGGKACVDSMIIRSDYTNLPLNSMLMIVNKNVQDAVSSREPNRIGSCRRCVTVNALIQSTRPVGWCLRF